MPTRCPQKLWIPNIYVCVCGGGESLNTGTTSTFSPSDNFLFLLIYTTIFACSNKKLSSWHLFFLRRVNLKPQIKIVTPHLPKIAFRSANRAMKLGLPLLTEWTFVFHSSVNNRDKRIYSNNAMNNSPLQVCMLFREGRFVKGSPCCFDVRC